MWARRAGNGKIALVPEALERHLASRAELPGVLAVGHSHLVSVSDAWQQAAKAAQPGYRMAFLQLLAPEYQPLLSPQGNEAILNPRVTRKLEELLRQHAPASIASFVLGNEHSVFGLVNHPRPFDFALPERPDLALEPGTEIVPHDLMRAMLGEWVKRFLAPILSSLKRVSGLPVRHFCSPPPIGSAAHIAAYPGIAAAKVRELGVAPAGLRLKLWLLYAGIVAEACAEAGGVQFIPSPTVAQNSAGFLDEPFWSKTPTHGNERYGSLVLAQLADLVKAPAR